MKKANLNSSTIIVNSFLLIRLMPEWVNTRQCEPISAATYPQRTQVLEEEKKGKIEDKLSLRRMLLTNYPYIEEPEWPRNPI